jgi:hypothetical protein
MHTTQRLRTITSTATVLCLLLLAKVGAQTPLTLTDAASILGTWTITFETAQGVFDRTLVVERRDNRVVGELKDWGNFHFEPTSDIRKTDEGGIAVRFAASYSGQAFSATVTMALYSDGKARFTFDANEGQTVLNGAGVRKD